MAEGTSDTQAAPFNMATYQYDFMLFKNIYKVRMYIALR